MNESICSFTCQDVQTAVDNELEEYSKIYIPAENPRAIILGGQSGAGKSTLLQAFKTIMHENVIEINGDEFRKNHPRFHEIYQQVGSKYPDYTNKFASAMTERLIEQLSEKKYNLLIEGTLRTVRVPLDTCDLLTARGYGVSLAVIAVKPILSYLGTVLRQEMMLAEGKVVRETSQEIHDQIVQVITANIDYLYHTKKFKNVYICTRDAECIFDSNKDSRLPSEVLNQIFHGAWSEQELREYRQTVTMIQILRGTDTLKEEENLLKYRCPSV